MAGAPLAKGRRDLAQIMKITSSTFSVTADQIVSIKNFDEERYESVTFLLRKIHTNIRKSKKNVDQLNTEWWDPQFHGNPSP